MAKLLTVSQLRFYLNGNLSADYCVLPACVKILVNVNFIETEFCEKCFEMCCIQVGYNICHVTCVCR